MVRLGPVDAHEDRQGRASIEHASEPQGRSRRANGPVLDRHATPAAISTILADHRGHALDLGLRALRRAVPTRRSGSAISLTHVGLIGTH